MKKLIVCLPIFIFVFFITGCTGDEGGGVPDLEPEHTTGGGDKGQQGQEASSSVKGGVIDVNLGGPNEPNSVYIDLSTGKAKEVRRDRWELGFYNGTENHVFLNASILVTAAKTEFTEIDQVTSQSTFTTPMKLKHLDMDSKTGLAQNSIFIDRIPIDSNLPQVKVTVHNVEELLQGLPLGYTMYGNVAKGFHFTDYKKGKLDGTAIGKIEADSSQAKVFIVSAGREIPDDSTLEFLKPASISTTGYHRGFYKIKVFIEGSQYVIQYAKLDEKTHKTKTITKDNSYNLSFFSFVNEKMVMAAPPKTDFDINFSGVFSFYDKDWESGITYSDYALTNCLGGTGVYVVLHKKLDREAREYKDTDEPAYEDFKKANVDESRFVYDNWSVIGSHWRNPRFFDPIRELIPGVYYIIKDVKGNLYKLKFTAYMSKEEERGHPQFKYELLE